MSTIDLEDSWKRVLFKEFSKPYMKELMTFLRRQRDEKKIIYPKASEYFASMSMTPLDRVKVVILGQDPYHGPEQAHGLCFSVPDGVKIPPSLKNIFKEIENDLGVEVPQSGNLSFWARQGVLLLNATLSVEGGKAGSHQKKGWEDFTDKVIQVINDECDGIVFLLWGAYAQKKGHVIDRNKHCVLQSPHPSPLSAHRGFLGCGHFSKANDYLRSIGKMPIEWGVSLPAELCV